MKTYKQFIRENKERFVFNSSLPKREDGSVDPLDTDIVGGNDDPTLKPAVDGTDAALSNW